ncbi:MAG: Rieske (2Fe-2S) protein [Verrucomicrobia bacterium]|nr:Rieske (2Fe-2S) protein [Verrucomicrobiota bacterium]
MKEENPIPENQPPSGAATTREAVALISRRRFLTRLSLSLAGVCAVVIGAPATGFVLAPLFRKVSGSWLTVGAARDFAIGETVTVVFEDPSPLPWAGITARASAWLRRDSEDAFTAFSAFCTHLGCPVRWMPGANLFLCPCHGGVYYRDGSVAAGPPPHPLVRYEVRVFNGNVQIKSAPIPITTTL